MINYYLGEFLLQSMKNDNNIPDDCILIKKDKLGKLQQEILKIVDKLDAELLEKKEKVSKAREYIKENYNKMCRFDGDTYVSCDKELLDILGGTDE